MIKTKSLRIITADDISLGKNVYQELTRVLSIIKMGRIEYGGKHYSGYALIIPEWKISKLCNKKIGLTLNDLKALIELSYFVK